VDVGFLLIGVPKYYPHFFNLTTPSSVEIKRYDRKLNKIWWVSWEQ